MAVSFLYRERLVPAYQIGPQFEATLLLIQVTETLEVVLPEKKYLGSLSL